MTVDGDLLDASRGRVLYLWSRYCGNWPCRERGIVKVNEEIEIVGIKPTEKDSTVTGVEMFRKLT